MLHTYSIEIQRDGELQAKITGRQQSLCFEINYLLVPLITNEEN